MDLKCLFQENKNKNLIAKLVEEMEDNEDDIYLAPELLDSSSAASKSILSFTSWLTSSHSPVPDFDFILVTDDRAFVALDSIANRLHKSVHASDRGKILMKKYNRKCQCCQLWPLHEILNVNYSW